MPNNISQIINSAASVFKMVSFSLYLKSNVRGLKVYSAAIT